MTLAFVFVNCGTGQNEGVAGSVKDIPGVLETNLTTGIYDLILKVQAGDEHKLEDVIKSIKAIAGVASTMTSIIYKADSFGISNASAETRS
jgi:2-isopropylmalate synthase